MGRTIKTALAVGIILLGMATWYSYSFDEAYEDGGCFGFEVETIPVQIVALSVCWGGED